MKKTLSILTIWLLVGLLSTSAGAFTYATGVKNARLDAVTAKIDAGSGAGKLEIGTAGMGTVLLTVTLNDPSAAAAASAVLTLSGFPKTVNATASGTAAAARIRDSDDNDVVTGLTVGTSGADIIVSTVSVSAGQGVTVAASPTITHY
jgi:hypothetical protein